MDKRSRPLITAALMVGLLVSSLDQTIVDTAFPRMIADLHGETIFTWVLTIYMLASTSVVPVVGKLADIYGRKIFYLLGLAIFVGGSMLCGMAQDMIQLIAFRGVQGIGGGMLMPISLTIIGDLYPGAERAKMQGLFGAVFGLSSIIGPKLGGWITHNFHWRWIFYINLPIGLIAMAMMFMVYKESKGQKRPIDWVGSFTVTASIILFLLALNKGGDWGWSSAATLGLFAATAALLAIFIYTERRVEEPVLDLKLFKNRTFTVSLLVGMITGAGMFGAIVFVPYFIQGVVGVNPDQAGNLMTPMMITTILFATLSGRLAAKLPYRYNLTAGFAFIGIGFILMSRWTVDTTLLTATLCSMVAGAGMGTMMPIMTLAVQNAFPANRRGVVTSAATFFRQVGATVGITTMGVIFNHEMAQRFQANLGAAMAQLGPMLAKMPAQAQEFFKEVVADPQKLMGILLSEQAQAGIPEALRTTFLGGAKHMMAESLHVVFLTGFGVVMVGLVVAQFLGNTSLKKQAEELGEKPHIESPLAAD